MKKTKCTHFTEEKSEADTESLADSPAMGGSESGIDSCSVASRAGSVSLNRCVRQAEFFTTVEFVLKIPQFQDETLWVNS